MIVEKIQPSGGLCISEVVNGELITRQYFGYPKKEAISQFRLFLNKQKQRKWYVGIKGRSRTAFTTTTAATLTIREIFQSTIEPTQQSHGEYYYVVGPFKTKRAAQFFVRNHSCHSVQEAEKRSKLILNKTGENNDEKGI